MTLGWLEEFGIRDHEIIYGYGLVSVIRIGTFVLY